MPVPKVSMMAVPVTPRPAPQRISAMPAASASFRNTAGLPSVLLSQRGPVHADPGLVDIGRRAHRADVHHTRERQAHAALRPGKPLRQAGDDLHHAPRAPRAGVSARRSARRSGGRSRHRPARLDRGAADIDAQYFASHRRTLYKRWQRRLRAPGSCRSRSRRRL